LKQLNVFPSGSEVSPELLAQKGLVRGKGQRVKILGDGALTKPLTIKAHGFSAAAKEKIEAAGGKMELLTTHA
jgi:large subunit ribosomal protein L15